MADAESLGGCQSWCKALFAKRVSVNSLLVLLGGQWHEFILRERRNIRCVEWGFALSGILIKWFWVVSLSPRVCLHVRGQMHKWTCERTHGSFSSLFALFCLPLCPLLSDSDSDQKEGAEVDIMKREWSSEWEKNPYLSQDLKERRTLFAVAEIQKQPLKC